jgi:hypothetical protein
MHLIDNRRNFAIDSQSQFAIYSITDCNWTIRGGLEQSAAGRVMIEE